MRESYSFDMPIGEAMQTQRAVRRLKTDPVDDELVLRLIEFALKAPTGKNAQNWEFVVVKDPVIKAQLGRQNGIAFRVLERMANRFLGNDDESKKIMASVRWQADHFHEIPVLVVACLKGLRPFFPAVLASSYYGSIYPSVQNLLLAARAVNLGAALITLPLWSHFAARRILGLPWNVSPCAVIPLGWARGPLWPHHTEACPRGGLDRPVWPPFVRAFQCGWLTGLWRMGAWQAAHQDQAGTRSRTTFLVYQRISQVNTQGIGIMNRHKRTATKPRHKRSQPAPFERKPNLLAFHVATKPSNHGDLGPRPPNDRHERDRHQECPTQQGPVVPRRSAAGCRS